MARRQPFTAEQDAAIRAAQAADWVMRAPVARALAARFGGTPERYILRARYLRIRGDYQKPASGLPDGVVQRRCLACGGTFAAPGPFIRVCTPCKHTEVWRAGA